VNCGALIIFIGFLDQEIVSKQKTSIVYKLDVRLLIARDNIC